MKYFMLVDCPKMQIFYSTRHVNGETECIETTDNDIDCFAISARAPFPSLSSLRHDKSEMRLRPLSQLNLASTQFPQIADDSERDFFTRIRVIT